MAITRVPSYGLSQANVNYRPKPPPKPKPSAAAVGITPTAAAARQARLEPGLGASTRGTVITAPPPSYGPSSVPGTPTFRETAPGGGSATFNPEDPYLKEFKSDPLYIDALKNYNDQLAASRLGLTQAIRGDVIRGGWGNFADALRANPGLAAYAGDIDQETLNQAAANQFSDRAMIQR